MQKICSQAKLKMDEARNTARIFVLRAEAQNWASSLAPTTLPIFQNFFFSKLLVYDVLVHSDAFCDFHNAVQCPSWTQLRLPRGLFSTVGGFNPYS